MAGPYVPATLRRLGAPALIQGSPVHRSAPFAGTTRGGILITSYTRHRAIQYAAASRLKHNRLWNTGSPAFAFAGDDTSCSTS